MKKIKKIIVAILVLSGLVYSSQAISAEKLGNKHEAGLQITGYYSYDEPDFMHNRSKLDDHLLDNFGLVYNFKHSRLINNYYSEFELDTDFKRIDNNYWSNGTGTASDIENDIYNIRLLGGFKISENIKIKTGFGYRHLEDKKNGIITTTGGSGYDRIQEYQYIPFVAEIAAPIQSINGTLKLEYDHIFYGKNKSKLSQVVGGTDVEFRNDDGYMVKASYKFPFMGLNLEPYYLFQKVQESDVVSGFQEPANHTNEYGIKLTKVFGESTNPVANNFTLPVNSNVGLYFGVGTMLTKIDTGFHSPTGTASIDEKEMGYKLFAGIPINNKLDLELAYNNFGDSSTTGNTGDTFVDGDGNYASVPGQTLFFNANNVSVNIKSNSTSFAIKPKMFSTKNIEIVPMIGMHKWDQSEMTSVAGVGAAALNYSGTDLIYGVGMNLKTDGNLSFSINYAEYPMYYDASAVDLTVAYKF
jgi:hypothetical protein